MPFPVSREDYLNLVSGMLVDCRVTMLTICRGTQNQSDRNKEMLRRNLSWLNNTPNFKVQCEMLKDFTKQIIISFKDGQ